jgi:uncharacterized protein YceK
MARPPRTRELLLSFFQYIGNDSELYSINLRAGGPTGAACEQLADRPTFANLIPFHAGSQLQIRSKLAICAGFYPPMETCMKIRAIAAATTLTCFTGCGTVMNLPAPCHGPDCPLRIYGGVRNDLEFATFKSIDSTSSSGSVATASRCALVALDLPLSFAADTISLPLTVPYSIARIVQERERPRQDSVTPSEK